MGRRHVAHHDPVGHSPGHAQHLRSVGGHVHPGPGQTRPGERRRTNLEYLTLVVQVPLPAEQLEDLDALPHGPHPPHGLQRRGIHHRFAQPAHENLGPAAAQLVEGIQLLSHLQGMHLIGTDGHHAQAQAPRRLRHRGQG